MATKPKAPKPQYPNAENDTSLPIRQRLARAFVTMVRKNPSYYPKSKAAMHIVALEYFRGAAIALNADGAHSSSNVMQNMFLVSIRGYEYVEELADKDSPKEAVLKVIPSAVASQSDTGWRVDDTALTFLLGEGATEADAWDAALVAVKKAEGSADK
jgi:hypothetical protein